MRGHICELIQEGSTIITTLTRCRGCLRDSDVGGNCVKNSRKMTPNIYPRHDGPMRALVHTEGTVSEKQNG